MKTKWLKYAFVMMLMIVSFLPVSAYADEPELEAVPLVITSGLGIETETETTFDESRLIYGEALPMAEVVLTVSHESETGILVEDHRETVSVGSLGLFSVAAPLDIGTNYVSITASAEGYSDASCIACVKRMDESVKEELKRIVALPGWYGLSVFK